MQFFLFFCSFSCKNNPPPCELSMLICLITLVFHKISNWVLLASCHICSIKRRALFWISWGGGGGSLLHVFTYCCREWGLVWVPPGAPPHPCSECGVMQGWGSRYLRRLFRSHAALWHSQRWTAQRPDAPSTPGPPPLLPLTTQRNPPPPPPPYPIRGCRANGGGDRCTPPPAPPSL